ncbi:hypothetical protein SAMN05661096_00922 [Marivirga sericea]|uniref:Uncharacterized protein n=1 Tax=Marivirga sericea TaxID=1028 RepID=A0A1X7IPW2_9BACT|nr:hypothetical protein [Marivirga sericea]SMG17101.1 hypothetical protein SAMN05661096_00922 [Marivirga sericea]
MKLSVCCILSLLLSFDSFSQKRIESLENSGSFSRFETYLSFEIKLVDFENSLYVNDLKTTEVQIENGFTHNKINFIDFSFGINGGVTLGIPYEDRRIAYFQNTNGFSYDTFIKLDEIDWIDQDLSKTRYFFGFHPQLTFNISEK